MTQEITHANLIKMRQALADMPQAQTLRNAVMNNGINAVAQRPDAAVTLDPTYSIDLPTGDVSFQKRVVVVGYLPHSIHFVMISNKNIT